MTGTEIAEKVQEVLRGNVANLKRIAAQSLEPRRLPDPAKWAPEHFWISPDVEAGAGPYDLSRRPWWVEPLQSVIDPGVSRVIVPASTQIGKTLNMIAVLLYLAEHSPAPAMVVLPTQAMAEEFRDRLYVNALRSRLSRVTVPPERRWNNKRIELGTMRVYIAWAGSRERMRGRPCRYVFLSEIDVYQTGHRTAGDPVRAAEGRCKAFWGSLIWLESSPSESPSRIVQMREAASDRREWWSPCTECGAWQTFRFFPHRSGPYAGNGGFVGFHKDATPEECRRQARYRCIKGCELSNSQVRNMRESGKWISAGHQTIDKKSGKVKGSRPADRSTVSYQLWAIHSMQTTLGMIAEKWAEHRDAQQLSEFWGNWLGMSYQRGGKLADWKSINIRLASKYERRTVPPDVWFLTAGSDVQDDRVYWVVRGWAPWIVSYLIDWGEFERQEGDGNQIVKSDLLQLNSVLHARWKVAGQSPSGKDAHRVRLLNIDSNFGGQRRGGVASRVMDVHQWIRSQPAAWRTGSGQRVRAVRGDSSLSGTEIRTRKKIVESNQRTGEPYPGGLEQWGINVRIIYPVQLDRLRGMPGQRGSFHVCANMLDHLDGKKYLRQLANFGPRDKRSADGTVKRIWDARDDRLGNDYWDCEIYGYSGAEMVLGDHAGAWSPQNFERKFLPRSRPNAVSDDTPRPTDER